MHDATDDSHLAVDDTVLTLLEGDLDGRLDAAESARLGMLLAGDPGLARAHREQHAVAALLASERIAVRPDFARQVMAGLPEAPWESRSRAWALPLALALILAVASTLVLGLGTGLDTGLGDTALGGAATAVADLAVTSLLAGAGLLGASWRGVGMGLEELFAGSTATLAAFAVLVVCVDLLFVALLLRRRRRTAEAAAEPADDGAAR